MTGRIKAGMYMTYGTNKTYTPNGFSTLEIVLALALVVLTLSSVTVLVYGSQTSGVSAQTATEALGLAQELLEHTQARAKTDFYTIQPTDSDAPIGTVTYHKTLSVQSLADFFIKLITSTVSWSGEDGRAEKVELTSLITDPSGPDGGNTCNSGLAGDWQNPHISSYEISSDLLVPPDSLNTYPVSDIDVFLGKLYISINNATSNTLPTFFIFDISDSEAKPEFISSMDNDSAVKAGLNAIHVAGEYVYAASAKQSNFSTCASGVCGQLQVIDVSISPPHVVKTFKIPGVTGTSGQAVGNSIFYKNGIVYLGLTKTGGGPEFNVIDVGGGGAGGSPTAPVFLGGFSVGNAVNAVSVQGGYAYVATPNSEELKILDVANPSAIVRVGGFDAPGGSGNGKSLFVSGDKLFFGRTLGGNEFYVLDSTNQAGQLPPLGAKDLGNESLNDLLVRDYLGFLLTNSQLQIWRVDEPGSMSAWAPAITLPANGKGISLDCEKNSLFLASNPSTNKGSVSVVNAGNE